MKSGYSVLDNLRRSPVASRKSRQAGAHGFDDRQTVSFEKSRLNERTAVIGDESIELTYQVSLCLKPEPSHAVFEAMAVHQIVHPLNLLSFLVIAGSTRIQMATYDKEVG